MTLPIAFCRAVTASPFDHSFSVRPEYLDRGWTPAAGAAPRPIRAYQTPVSVMPVTGRPLMAWYSRTRSTVEAP